MLTISKPITVGQALTYYLENYSNADDNYYSEGERIRGEWFGQLCDQYGLLGAVQQEPFECLAQGQHPHTGEQRRMRVGPHTRINKYGDEIRTKGSLAGYDLTFSADKSVSLAALVGGDARIREAHHKAVKTALGAIEAYILAKMGGIKPSVKTGKMFAAIFEHDTARPDKKSNYAAPQLHSHAVVFNLAELTVWKWRSLDSRELFNSQAYGTAIYRAVIAIDLERLGYEIEVDSRTGAPRIVGFSNEYLEESSPRRKELREEAARMRERLEAEGNVVVRDGAGLRQAAASAYKRSKNFNREKMLERHQEMDKKYENQAHKAVEAALERGPIEYSAEEILKRAREAAEFGINRVMDLEAVGDPRDVVIQSLRRNMGLTTYEAVKEELGARRREGKLIGIIREERAAEVTTRRTLELEGQIIHETLEGKAKHQPILDAKHVKVAIEKFSRERGITLNTSQREAVERLLSNRDRIMGLQGRAGTGKETVLSALKAAAEEAGVTVRGFATTARAVKELSKSGIETTSIKKFVFSKRKEAAAPRNLFVLDESSLGSSNLINKFFERIGPDDRVWFVGDIRRRQSVEDCSPFEQLQKNGMETAMLTQIVRQKDEGLRKVVEKFSERQVRDAVKDLISQGRVVEVPDTPDTEDKEKRGDEKRLKLMASDYCANRKSAVIISPGNKGRVLLNMLIHEGLQERGIVAREDYQTTIYVNRADMTKTERRFAGAYNPGDIIRYNRKCEGYGTKVGDYGEVVSRNNAENTITVKLTASGKVIKYDPRRLSGVSVYVKREVNFAVGDRIQFRAPLAAKKVANGDFGKIRKISKQEWQVKLDGGQVIKFDPNTFPHFDLGYAVTSYSSQCATFSRALIHFDTKEKEELVNDRTGYVSVSRAKHTVLIYTDSKEKLAAALDRRVDKEMAFDSGLPDSQSELWRDRVILGAAVVLETRRLCASLDAEAARNYGRAYRLESAGAERREMKERLAEEDLARHSETLKAHNKAREELVRRLEDAEARAISAHYKAESRAQVVGAKYQGKQAPIPFIPLETLNKVEDQAIRHGLSEQIKEFEGLRAKLSKEHGYEKRTDYDASRLAGERLTARVEFQARLERAADFDELCHLQRYDIDGAKWSLGDLDRALERARDQAKFFGKYEIHLDKKLRADAAGTAARLTVIREEVVNRIKESKANLAEQVEEARKLADVLDSAYAREGAARAAAGKSAPAPVLTAGELKRIETNLPSIRDDELVRQLSNLKLTGDAKINQSGRAFAREIIAEIGVREAAEELAAFKSYGGRQAVLIEFPDGQLRTYRPDDLKPRSGLAWLVETSEDRATRRAVETAFAKKGQRLTRNYEKELSYYQAVHKQAGGQMGERGTPDLLPAEKIRIEIFAEKLTAPEERARYLKLARQSAPAPELKSRAQAGLDVKPNAMALDDAERIQKSERAAGQPTEESERPDPGLTPTPGMPEERKTQRPPSSFKKVVTQLQSDGYEHPAETKVKLVRVTPRKPCPVCGRKKYCSVREDGAFAICTKVPSERTTKNGQHYIHILDESTRDFPRHLAREVTQHLRADARSRDEINRRLLGGLKLQPRDQNDLLNRGLDKAAIGRYGYKSIPQPAELNDLMKTFEGADLRGIPGFFRKDGDWRLNIGEWKDKHNTIHSFHQGYIIPIRDIDDRIVGCQIRRAYARDDEPRYLWLSSNEKEDGTSSGAPTHYRNIELARKTGQLILTEGALKADVAAHLLDNQYALIAVPGVSTFSEDFGQRLREQIPELRQVVIIFDSDQAENDDVKRALVRLRGSSEEPDKGPGTLREAGLDVRELTWGKDLGKGLDDLLLANPDRRVQVKEFLEESRASLNDGSGATIVSQDRVKSRQLGQEIVF